MIILDDGDVLLTEDEVVEEFGHWSKKTLQTMRSRRRGPPYCKLGAKVHYRRSKIISKALANEIDPDKLRGNT